MTRVRGGLIVLVLAGAACVRAPGVLGLRAAPKVYMPLMSSTVGIALSPILPPGAAAGACPVHWRTNYGTFVRWEPPAHRVEPLGADATVGFGTVYWTYDANDMGKPKPDVEIVAQACVGRGAAARGVVRLAWDREAARVRE